MASAAAEKTAPAPSKTQPWAVPGLPEAWFGEYLMAEGSGSWLLNLVSFSPPSLLRGGHRGQDPQVLRGWSRARGFAPSAAPAEPVLPLLAVLKSSLQGWQQQLIGGCGGHRSTHTLFGFQRGSQ